MDTRRIRHFLVLAETLNFSEAARRSGVSQPALSKSIANLEAELGGSLIRREGRLTHLTHLGQAMALHLREVERATSAAKAEANRLSKGAVQPLEIAVMCTVGPSRLSPFVLKFLTDHPDVELSLHDVTTARIGADLLGGRVDLAVLGAPVTDSDRLRHIELYTEDMVMACAVDHPYASRPSVKLEDLSRQPYLDRLHCEFRDTFLATAVRENVPMRVTVRSEREDWIQSLVQGGQGVTILPRHSVVLDGIATVPLNRRDMKRSVMLSVATGRQDAEAVRDFVDGARRHDWQ
ncbi:LysR family transcriptional regulator [Parasedimentitalea maritima]|uniref:LysR family transcriptional regulator n=1 Tax=Parasedimentitalea maritima TaxID=2578117 RepID=A0ABY2V041_9RHOB|nr:LysR family transcriptional regulator [Zongyanglinia marina]TLP69078.1 LysR family transcriptional regulator [Zongyanglinia marina]